MTLTTSPRQSVLPLRREFLRAAGACATMLAISGYGNCSPKIAEEPEVSNLGDYIDTHVHVWSADTTRYPLAPGYTKKPNNLKSFTAQELFSHSGPNAVKRVVLIQISFYGCDNSYMLDTIKANPQIFSGVAVIDENKDPVETMRKLGKRGVRGFRVRPGKRSTTSWLSNDGMNAMWSEAADTGQNIGVLIKPKHLPAIDQMCARHPNTPVVIDHLGRVGFDGQMREQQVEDLCRLARHQHVKVKVSAFQSLGAKRPPYLDLAATIRRVFEAFGPKRLMWGSDSPFQVVDGHNYANSINLIHKLAFLTETDRDWILRKTAEETYF